jgi:hypothetical protein
MKTFLECKLKILNLTRGDRLMKLLDMVSKVTQYLSEAAARIFGPKQDDYPKTGVQPYTGDPSEEPKWG